MNDRFDLKSRRHAMDADRVLREYRDFAYHVSHDFSAHLRTIEVFAQMLEQEHGELLNDSGRKQLAFLRKSSQRMSEMVQALLSFSRVGSVDRPPSQVSIAALAERARQALTETFPELEVRVEEPGHEVLVDDKMAVDILTELFTNACRFSSCNPCSVSVRASTEDGLTTLRISDRGPGIPPEHREAVFSMFRSLHPEGRFPGVGAGLTLARRRAEYLGGSLSLEENPEGGCTAVLILPPAESLELPAD